MSGSLSQLAKLLAHAAKQYERAKSDVRFEEDKLCCESFGEILEKISRQINVRLTENRKA